MLSDCRRSGVTMVKSNVNLPGKTGNPQKLCYLVNSIAAMLSFCFVLFWGEENREQVYLVSAAASII
jgi:hypothetical protein